MKRSILMVVASAALVLGVPGVAHAQFSGCDSTTSPDFNGDGACNAGDDLNRDGTVSVLDAGYTPPATVPPAVGGLVITPTPTPTPQAQPLPPQAAPQAQPRSQVLGVTQTRGSLVRTGLEAAPFAAAGAALVGAGAVLVLGARKRRDAGIPA